MIEKNNVSENYKKEVIKKFNVLMKKNIKSRIVDFCRANNSRLNKEVSFNEIIKYEASLSQMDNGAFFLEEKIHFDNLEDNFNSPLLLEILNTMTKAEKEIIKKIVEERTDAEISKELNITIRTVQNKKSLIKKKFINGGIDYDKKNK